MYEFPWEEGKVQMKSIPYTSKISTSIIDIWRVSVPPHVRRKQNYGTAAGWLTFF